MIAYSILESLNHWDQQLFLLINKSWTNDFLESFLPFWREKKNWIPLYVLIFFVAIYKHKKHAWWWILMFVITVALADAISSHVFKPWVDRIRPCQLGSGIEDVMQLRLPRCPGNRSFTSSHAANHFAMAFYIFFTSAISMKWSRWLFILWAAIISYAQIFVGVHYPGDILGGMVLALLLALLTSSIYLKYQNRIKNIKHE